MASTQAVSEPLSTNKPVSTKGKSHLIGIADIRVTHAPGEIKTVLGSCIGIALYDAGAKIGGMAHVILPSSNEGSGNPGKFADSAVDQLLSDLISEGASRKRIRAKIVGGATMFGGPSTSSLGERNAVGVKDQLAKHSIPIAASAIGGTKGRKMVLDVATGDVEVRIIGEAPEVI